MNRRRAGQASSRISSGSTSRGVWKWAQNPFVGTDAYRGLLVLMMVLNSTESQGRQQHSISGPSSRHPPDVLVHGEGSRRYVWRDRSLLPEARRHRVVREAGRSSRSARARSSNSCSRGVTRSCSSTSGRPMSAWTCRRLQRLTDAQLRDAFRAGGFSPETTARFVRRIREKVGEGLALAPQRQAS